MQHRGGIMSRWLLIVSCSLVVCAAACKEKNSEYCTGHPNDTANCPPDAGSGCTQDDQCSGKVCDTASGACVVCTPSKAMACTGTTPVCSTSDTCGPCTSHSQCTMSNVCLPDGSCSDGANVAYVAASGSGTACTQAMPCNKLAAAVATNKPYIKIAAGLVKDSVTTTIDGKSVTILAEPGAKLDRDNDGPILVVQSANADVKVYDLEITGASGASGADGIQLTPNGGAPKLTLTRVKIDANQGTGIATTGGVLTMAQSTVSGNTGGGLSVSSTEFDLTNNMIVKNGSATSSFGGVLFTQTNTGTRKLAFNTIAQNQATTGITPGVLCAAVANAVQFADTIVFGNGAGLQVEGTMCTWTYSDIGPTAATGSGNINMDPMFANATQNDFHLMSTSPCKDAADPAATLNVDFDGDARPQGPHSDIGADEYK